MSCTRVAFLRKRLVRVITNYELNWITFEIESQIEYQIDTDKKDSVR